MKKLLLIFALTVLLAFSGCSGGGSSQCTKTGLIPNATYRIIYAHPVYPPTAVLIRTASASGTITTPSYGDPCWGLQYYLISNANVSLSASPSSIYLPTPPSTATITGSGFDTTYGMPQVEYFDSNGYLVGSVAASSVSGGTSLQASVPSLAYAYSGTYQVKVTNMNSAGYYTNIVGTASITAWGRDRTDSDGDGYYDDEDCDPYDPYLNWDCSGGGSEICGGGMEPIYVCP